MIYTIVSLEVCHTPYSLYLDKIGNKYAVGLYNSKTKQTIDRHFDAIDEAYKTFGALTEWYAKGSYKQEEKESYLLSGTIPE